MVKRRLKFLVDRMLGKLARYLLMLGIDTLYFTQPDRSELIALAKKQGRVILTRDTRLRDARDLPDLLFIVDDLAEAQLRQVVNHFGITMDKEQLFTRCLRCNKKLIKKTPEEVKHFVPPYILTVHQEFSSCPQCEKVYWKGTHQKRMEEMIEELFECGMANAECGLED
jgi:uncharacterized protein with PIN domain